VAALQSTREGDLARTLAIALVCAGAVGNLIDRIRWHEGVVDFIDVGSATCDGRRSTSPTWR
jgi:signal peptidase II